MVLKFNDILKVAQSRGFIKILPNGIKYENPSFLICNNIKTEWLKYTLTRTKNKLKLIFRETENACHKGAKFEFPCGVAEIQNNTKIQLESFKNDLVKSNNDYYQTLLKFTAYLSQDESINFFHQWQHYRKIWWSRITCTPGLFALTDTSYNVSNTSVKIKAKFPWCEEIVETIDLQKEAECNRNFAALTSQVYLNDALFTLFSDGVICGEEEHILKFHRKMSPYKFSFTISGVNTTDLQELAIFINTRLNRNGLSTLLNNLKDNLLVEDTLKCNAKLGIPYTIVLTDETLNTGIFGLVSRDTKLQEQVHLSTFDDYAMQLFKNF